MTGLLERDAVGMSFFALIDDRFKLFVGFHVRVWLFGS